MASEAVQLVLPISWALPRDANGFVVSSCNEYAVNWLEKWPFEIRENFVCLLGEKGAGKTHLATIWATRLNADIIDPRRGILDRWFGASGDDLDQKFFVLDDADSLNDDILLFYIYNTIKAKNAFLLMTARTYPRNWEVRLNDVKSRIATMSVVRIQKPDEVALPSIITKMLHQRGIVVGEDVAQYVSNRIERSYESINYWVNTIDSRLAATRSKISLKAIRQILTIND
ncbi:MAG: hypothetical protein LBJ69_02650 [Holosporales bacterium]|nr:hypothetical protein [Holosporales bacterium]